MEEAVRTVVKDTVTKVLPYLQEGRLYVNRSCAGLEAWQIIAYTTGVLLMLLTLYNFIFDNEKSIKYRIKRQFFSTVRSLPYVKQIVAKKIAQNAKYVEAGIHRAVGKTPYVLRLPSKGLTEEELGHRLQEYESMAKVDWSKGLVSGVVYNGDPKLTRVLSNAYQMFAWTNLIHPDMFPDVRKMEAEVVRMCCSIFSGGPKTCGAVTSGGTESILLACLAYRNRAREKGIRFPEIVAPITVHPAFDKAANYFHMKITHIPIDRVTRKVNVSAMRRAINRNTCLLVGSAPGYPHGIIDPIEEIAALGLKYNIPVHTDCCLGGFLVPFMEKAGFPIPPVDFRVPGITSISADTHKYGFAPKGSSVVLYSDAAYRRHQWFVHTDWPGGIYASPTLGGSRPGALVAACWAAMMYFGEDGYVEATRKIISTTRYLTKELAKIPGLYVIGEPELSVVAIASDVFNIFRLTDALEKNHWSLTILQFPASVHLCVTLLHAKPGVADRFLKEVRESVEDIMKDPQAPCHGIGAVYGMSQRIPDRSMVHQIASLYLDACYSTQAPETPESNGSTKTAETPESNGSTKTGEVAEANGVVH